MNESLNLTNEELKKIDNSDIPYRYQYLLKRGNIEYYSRHCFNNEQTLKLMLELYLDTGRKINIDYRVKKKLVKEILKEFNCTIQKVGYSDYVITSIDKKLQKENNDAYLYDPSNLDIPQTGVV